MKISYNWLSDYLDTDLSAEELKDILTIIGLEVEGIERYEPIEGGLEGLVVGKVLQAEKHPQADRLWVTQVDTGQGEPLNIVCGAPNVAAGQHVVVAPVGSTLYGGEKPFKIKKGKIRGQVSEGMICAEDELGIGNDHTGIIELPETTPIGSEVKDFYNLQPDTVIEIDLTPNRADGASHLGVARDLAAYLSYHKKTTTVKRPDTSAFAVDKADRPIPVHIDNPHACRRYSGLTISGLTVKESPDWLKQRLQAIGLAPINNVVDITNYILHEYGQPLHAFDTDKIHGQQVIVKTVNNKTPFLTLDENTLELSDEDLMICDAEGGMCIAGVFGGHDSGVTDSTTSIFLESACFDPVYVRKTSKRHDLKTDAAYRFERGTDPEITVEALKRAALLIKQIAGGYISSEIVDEIPEPIKHAEIMLRYSRIEMLLGIAIPKEDIKHILQLLDIDVLAEQTEGLQIRIPAYRVDVTREADVIEEILRIYGYDQIAYTDQVHSTLAFEKKPNPYKLEERIAEQLSAQGLSEALSMSMNPAAYYSELERFPAAQLVYLENPLSRDLNTMRQTLLFGHLDSVKRNVSYKNADTHLYELGNCYHIAAPQATAVNKKYHEEKRLGITLSGHWRLASWLHKEEPVALHHLKSLVDAVFTRLNYSTDALEVTELQNDIYAYGLQYKLKGQLVAEMGAVRHRFLEQFELDQDVLFAEIRWDILLAHYTGSVRYQPLSKFPAVKRDLALLLDKAVSYQEVKQLAFATEKKLLKAVHLFDVYEGKQIEAGKKSYAVNFTLQDESKTLKDKQIDKAMNRLIAAYKNELGATIR